MTLLDQLKESIQTKQLGLSAQIKAAEAYENIRKQSLENDEKEEDNKGKTDDNKTRTSLSDKVFSFASVYMFCVFLLLLLTGMPNHFKLSDEVLITILGTTTANIIGILIIMVTYYFHKAKK